MKRLLITGIALCLMGLAVPSFAAPRQGQTQQDQMKHDDGMKHDDMSKGTTEDQVKHDDNMKHDDMSKATTSKGSKSKKTKKDNMKHDDASKY